MTHLESVEYKIFHQFREEWSYRCENKLPFLLLTQCSHLFRKVCSETAEKVATGQQVKGRVAPHGVKGEWIHGTRETGHMTHLVLPVGCHLGKVLLVVQVSALGVWLFPLLPLSFSGTYQKFEMSWCHPAPPSCWLFQSLSLRLEGSEMVDEKEEEKDQDPTRFQALKIRKTRKSGCD